MQQTYLMIYTVVALCLAIFDFSIAIRAFRKPERIAKALGLCAVFAGEITLAYVLSVNTTNALWVSVASSFCFAGIDWMLAVLMFFALLMTKLYTRRVTRTVMWTVRALALADTLALISNIATHAVVTYERLDPVGITYHMKPLYVAHLVFTYLIIAATLAVLIYKSSRTPPEYRDQYMLLIAAISVVVAINAVFLSSNAGSFFTLIDCSVLGYSVGLYLMYWTAFNYRENDMLRSLSMTIFENIDQGIALFDYADALIMHNRRADELLEGVAFQREMPKARFMEACGIAEREDDRYSVQCDIGGRPLRCDFRRIRSARACVIGNLFVFTDLSRDTDIITGFEYERELSKYSELFGHPSTVVVFDPVGLREVNRTHGRDEGDRHIRSLANHMRAYMPARTCFLRGYEANLIAVCPGTGEADLRASIRRVVEASEGAVIYGVSATSQGDGEDGERRDVMQAREVAYRAVQVKKLLSPGSQMSQTLSSLVRALEETDPDTEAHVRRTRKMGTALGRRIGLNDAQLTDLALLCLLHDIGKITIPLEILNKPGKLTDQEWASLRTHAQKGCDIARSSDELKCIAEMVLCHHERWDGKGYPHGLAGKKIPILSRIIAVVDAYDAMVNDRSYRKALSPEAAQAEIRDNAGTQFDPDLAREFLEMLAQNPDIAVGEKVGGGEVRVYEDAVEQDLGAGEAAPIAFSRYLLDMDERIVEVDARFEEITGYAPEEVVGRMSQFDLIPAENRAFYMAQVNNQFSRGNIAYLRHHLQRKDGTSVQVVCFGKRYYDSAIKAFRGEIVIFEE